MTDQRTTGTTETALHAAQAVQHAVHEAVHAAGVVTQRVVEVARHDADVVLDAVLSPLTPELDDLVLDVTEEDVA